ncbi:MAG: DUF484 family protein [Zoogloeaceae bacterium]|jgi:uncharacterized protein YigA (DUF484 family)|nr:DUF484 family protein [Zoogloeaceae bacterium]
MSEQKEKAEKAAKANLAAGQVMAYLEANTQFFEHYADRLAAIFVPHPYGGRTISLTERQIIALREQNRQLEEKLASLLAFGEANDAISEKVQRLAVALIGAENAAAVAHLTTLHLRDDFSVPHVAFGWKAADEKMHPPGFLPLEEQFLDRLEKPYCGSRESFDTALFGKESHIRSQALVRLHVPGGKGGSGILAMGSEEAQRFYAGMGTLYLERLGELVSAALGRHMRQTIW